MKLRLPVIVVALGLSLLAVVPAQGTSAPVDPGAATAKLDSGLKMLAAAAAQGRPPAS